MVNGLLITWLRLAPFIATLATMGATTGVALVISGGQQVTGGPPAGFTIGNTFYAGIVTLPVLVSFLTVVVLGLFLHYARFGRITYAIGSNAFAVRAAGVSINGHLMRLYTLAGVVAGLGGFVVYTRLGGGSPAADTNMVLNAIAASVVGGVSLFGGVGRMAGTVLGALIITSVLSGLIVLDVNPNWQQVVIGIIIAIAVALQTKRGTRRKSLRKQTNDHTPATEPADGKAV
jgi:ribose transport system permease protein